MSQYNKFGDFATEEFQLTGQKVPLDQIINKEIIVKSYRISDSKYAKSNSHRCLTVQFECDGIEQVFFTGSQVLINQCEKYKDKMPFCAVIKKVDRYYTFS